MIDAIDSVVLNFPRQFGFCEKLKKIARFLRWFKGEEERRERVEISKILTGELIHCFFFFVIFLFSHSALSRKQFFHARALS